MATLQQPRERQGPCLYPWCRKLTVNLSAICDPCEKAMGKARPRPRIGACPE